MTEEIVRARSDSISTSEALEANRDLWDQWTDVHVESDFYAVDQFLDGETSLRSIELEELETNSLSLVTIEVFSTPQSGQIPTSTTAR